MKVGSVDYFEAEIKGNSTTVRFTVNTSPENAWQGVKDFQTLLSVILPETGTVERVSGFKNNISSVYQCTYKRRSDFIESEIKLVVVNEELRTIKFERIDSIKGRITAEGEQTVSISHEITGKNSTIYQVKMVTTKTYYNPRDIKALKISAGVSVIIVIVSLFVAGKLIGLAITGGLVMLHLFWFMFWLVLNTEDGNAIDYMVYRLRVYFLSLNDKLPLTSDHSVKGVKTPKVVKAEEEV
eukprot:snap_masked-scaffold_36-processed-gene-2.44-mRNA-1 protein AED:1.00 eAED:1.00 QI:0/-1/0/0/-1/1/1/0/239